MPIKILAGPYLPDYFAGFHSPVIGVPVDGDTTWPMMKELVIDEYNAISDGLCEDHLAEKSENVWPDWNQRELKYWVEEMYKPGLGFNQETDPLFPDLPSEQDRFKDWLVDEKDYVPDAVIALDTLDELRVEFENDAESWDSWYVYLYLYWDTDGWYEPLKYEHYANVAPFPGDNDWESQTLIKLVRINLNACTQKIEEMIYEEDIGRQEVTTDHDCSGEVFGGLRDVQHVSGNIWRLEFWYGRDV